LLAKEDTESLESAKGFCLQSEVVMQLRFIISEFVTQQEKAIHG